MEQENKKPAVIYEYDEERAGIIKGYDVYARLVDGILEALYTRYGVRYELYASDDPNSEYWKLLENDVQSGNAGVEHVARIFDRLEDRTFVFDDEKEQPEYHIHLSVRNNVLAYPAMGIALARVPVFQENGINFQDYVFAASDAQLQFFLGNVRKRQREQNINKVTVFTDRRNGISREDEPITRAVRREEVILDAGIKKRSTARSTSSSTATAASMSPMISRTSGGFCSTGIRATARPLWSNPLPEACRDRCSIGRLRSIRAANR